MSTRRSWWYTEGAQRRHRERGDVALLEATLDEPVPGARGEHEQALDAGLARPALDMPQQAVARARVAVFRMHGEAGQLGRMLALASVYKRANRIVDAASMESSTVDVLIVGAGPEGLMTAEWMSRLNVKTRIIDKRGTKVVTPNHNNHTAN